MRRLSTIVCRFFFLDDRTKAIDIHPTDTASDPVYKLADKLCLRSIDGWSIYQSRSDGEEHVRAHYYLYNIIAAWKSYVLLSNLNVLFRFNLCFKYVLPKYELNTILSIGSNKSNKPLRRVVFHH